LFGVYCSLQGKRGIVKLRYIYLLINNAQSQPVVITRVPRAVPDGIVSLYGINIGGERKKAG